MTSESPIIAACSSNGRNSRRNLLASMKNDHRRSTCCKKCRHACKSLKDAPDTHFSSRDQHTSVSVKRRKIAVALAVCNPPPRPFPQLASTDVSVSYQRDAPYLLRSSPGISDYSAIIGRIGCSSTSSIDSSGRSAPSGDLSCCLMTATTSSNCNASPADLISQSLTLAVTKNDRSATCGGFGVPTLLDLAARRTAQHYGALDVDQRLNGRVPEPAHRRLLFWAFPRDESRVRLYSSGDSSARRSPRKRSTERVDPGELQRTNFDVGSANIGEPSAGMSCQLRGDAVGSRRRVTDEQPSVTSFVEQTLTSSWENFCSRTCELMSRKRATRSSSSEEEEPGDCSSFTEGRRCCESNCVADVIQIGHVLSGTVRSVKLTGPEDTPARVSLSFDRCRITSVTCSCDHRDFYWCHHAVAVTLFRIRRPYDVEYRYSLSDSLLQLDRNQLQKLVQHLLAKSDHCVEILPIAQEIIDDLASKNSSINCIPGAPDPTMGCSVDSTFWHFDENVARSRIKLYLLHTFRHDELLTLFSKVREMLRQRDENGPKFLRIITEEFLCSLSSAGTSNRPFLSASNAAGSSGSFSCQTKSQHEKFQQLWDQISVLWVCVVLNPYASNHSKEEWHDLLKCWTLLPNCPTESSFSLPSNTFCAVHTYRINGCSDKSIFSPALQASQISWQNSFFGAILSNQSRDGTIQQLPSHWPESIPVTCARIESLRTNGYTEQALKLAFCLSKTVTKFDGSDPPTNRKNFPFWSLAGEASNEPWIGHPLDPVNALFDCLLQGAKKSKSNCDWLLTDFHDGFLTDFEHGKNCARSPANRHYEIFACLGVDWALVALLKPRRVSNCRFWKEKTARQEDELLAKLKKLNIQGNEALFSVIRRRAINLLEDLKHRTGSALTSDSHIPLHSVATFLFHVFLHKETDLAYKIGLEAFKNQVSDEMSDDKVLIAPLLTWTSGHCCDSSEIRHKQSTLASSLIIAAKDDSKRLSHVLNAIRQNAKNASLVYHLAYDIYKESLNHAEGSKSRANMLNIAFELGLQVLKIPSNQPNWCRPSVVRWVVTCATSLNIESVFFLIHHWADYFTPHEAVSVLARVAWSETVNVQLKLDPNHRAMLSHYVQQMALECATKSPAECSLHAITICKGNDTNFEAAFRITMEGGERRTMSPEDLFSIAQHLERIMFVEQAFQLALLACANLKVELADDNHPSAIGIYWFCGFAKTLGRLQLGHAIGYLCQNVRSPVILTNSLKLCISPMTPHHHQLLSRHIFLDKQQISWAAAQNALHAQPYLQTLLKAAVNAYVESVPTRLNHISPRHYCEFIDFLHKARDVFSLTDSGDHQFINFVNHMKNLYKGKKKLIALITQKIA